MNDDDNHHNEALDEEEEEEEEDDDDDEEEVDYLELLVESLADIFAENPEVWVERQPPPRHSQISTSNSNNASAAVVSLGDLDDDCILKIASYFDAPHDMCDFFQTCRATWSAAATAAAYPLLLDCVLRYFSIFKTYADPVEAAVEGGWPTMVKFLTHVARELQTKVYGSRWVVHPLHRALIAEVILEQVCGVTCEDLVPNQQQQPLQVPHERVRLSLDLCNAGSSVQSQSPGGASSPVWELGTFL
jgi:hypothetical protein